MSSAEFVDDAARFARGMIDKEAQGPGDIANAMRRLETRYGISFSTFWALRYRKPKTIDTGIYARLEAAHRAQCDLFAALGESERRAAATKTRFGATVLRLATALDRSEDWPVIPG